MFKKGQYQRENKLIKFKVLPIFRNISIKMFRNKLKNLKVLKSKVESADDR